MIPLPGKSEPYEIEKVMNKMFPPEWLRATAAKVGCVKRNRKIDPVILFWSWCPALELERSAPSTR
ncbi:putative transposase [Thermacetogenium phaeum DSM 12270]|uniref:Putative transposase n=2 Tax=Thermacetogenium phaeum TaxID=85874 RepID=K4LGZ9_THEPS|nr:hypothetical protein [Thermacetogenium phaeum]AFV12163.1 putative transposase [Thermacetogenium phaeum DSM 12270]MDK2881328.1 hypothetical protein [Clostridia bacterium]